MTLVKEKFFKGTGSVFWVSVKSLEVVVGKVDVDGDIV